MCSVMCVMSVLFFQVAFFLVTHFSGRTFCTVSLLHFSICRFGTLITFSTLNFVLVESIYLSVDLSIRLPLRSAPAVHQAAVNSSLLSITGENKRRRGEGAPRQLGGSGSTLSNIALAASPNHYVMCRAASSGAGDSAESCWGEFL